MSQIRSYRGKILDTTEVFGNGKEKTLGNMNVNAQGDLIDAEGNVVKTHDQVVREYHTENQKSVVRSSLLDDIDDDFEIDFEPQRKQTKKAPVKKSEPEPSTESEPKQDSDSE